LSGTIQYGHDTFEHDTVCPGTGLCKVIAGAKEAYYIFKVYEVSYISQFYVTGQAGSTADVPRK